MVEKPTSPGSYVLGIEKRRSCHRHGSLRCDNAAKFRDPLAGPGAVASGARHIPPRLSGYRKRLVALSFGNEISVRAWLQMRFQARVGRRYRSGNVSLTVVPRPTSLSILAEPP